MEPPASIGAVCLTSIGLIGADLPPDGRNRHVISLFFLFSRSLSLSRTIDQLFLPAAHLFC